MKASQPNVIATTTSLRRKRLLKKLFPRVYFLKPSYHERKLCYFPLPGLLSQYHAFRKLTSIAPGTSLLLAFDTMVFRGWRIYHKPENEKEALDQISRLSGKTHKVITAIAVKHGNRLLLRSAVSKVKFRKLSISQIRDYISSGLWQGKAGGYGIQDPGNDLIEKYQGDYYNIVGLPLYALLSRILSF